MNNEDKNGNQTYTEFEMRQGVKSGIKNNLKCKVMVQI